MALLLDTHAALWYLLEDPKLSSVAKTAIEKEQQQVYISPASYWEVAIKIKLGAYTLNVPFDCFWNEAINAGGLTLLPIAITHAAQLTELPLHHRDPFDRMLVAQSRVENLPVVSCDAQLDRYGIRRIW